MPTGLFVCGNIEVNQNMAIKCIFETLISTIDDLIIFDNYKSNKLDKIVSNLSQAKVVKINIDDCKDWGEIRDFYASVIQENNIDTLIFTKTLIREGFDCKTTSHINSFRKALKAGKINYSFTFNSAKAFLSKFYFIATAAKFCENVYHLVLDPKEADFSTVMKFSNYQKLYGMNRYGNFKFMPCFEYGTSVTGKSIDKDCDFIFYCTAAAKNRQWIADQKEQLEAIDGWDVKIQIAQNLQKETKQKPKLESQNSYYDKLAKAKYTLCIKAYIEDAFSMYRLIEALSNNCLSFVMQDCCLDDVEQTYPQMYNIIKEYLVVQNFDDIRNKIAQWSEDDRLDVISQLKATKEWKAITNLNYVKKCWGKLPGINIKEG